ncbi:MAG: hypothetical protein ACC652_05570 [Acidimicrobiales bacterium]
MARRARTSAERALDLFVYAPIGLFVAAAERLPEFVESGRRVMHQGAPSQSSEQNEVSEPLLGYDEMTARSLLGQLGDLDSDLLRQIQEYESRNRGRRTVLGRIEQLLEDRQ